MEVEAAKGVPYHWSMLRTPAVEEDDYDSVYSIVGMPLTFKRAIFGTS